MLYSGNRKLGIVAVGTPDMNPLYSGSAAIESGINAFTAASLTFNSLISIASGFQQVQTEWPKPCEYFNGTLLASEFPLNLDGVNELGISIPYIIRSGSEGYNIIQTILNTPTGSSQIIQNGFIDNKNYEFQVKDKLISGNITYVAGDVILLNPDLPSFSELRPQMAGGFLLEISEQNQELIFLSNNSKEIYQINSQMINQSVTYRTENVIHICGENI